MFRVILCILFYLLPQLIFSTLLKGIIRKECQSFTNHGHNKTQPTVFNPLSLWLTLPRDMGVSHTQWPHSITGAILACLWFAQGISPNQNSFQWHYRKECLSFTNHGHAKTQPTVFNPLSLWLTLPRDMGVSHTLWPLSITRAILACLWFAQGISPNQNSFQGHYPQRMPIFYKPRTR